MSKRTKRIILAVLAGAGGALIAASITHRARAAGAVTQSAQTLLEALSADSVTETTE